VSNDKRNRRLVLILIGVIIVGSIYGVYRIVTWDPDLIVSVDQGDRVILNSARGANLIGIRCLPRQSPLGEDAAAFVEARVLDGDTRLVRGAEPTDKVTDFDWVYVYYRDKGVERMLNAELVRAGLAIAHPQGLNTGHRKEIKTAEDEAKAARRGLWAPENADQLKALR